MAELAVKMTSQDQQLAAAVQSLEAGIGKVDAAFEKSEQASHKAAAAAKGRAAEQAKLASQGKRLAESLIKQNEDLSESYERQAKLLQEAHKDGKISTEQLALATAQLEKKHEDVAAANRAQAKAATAAAAAEKQAAHQATDAYKEQQSQIKRGIDLTKRLEDESRTLGVRYYELKKDIKAAFDAGKMSAGQYQQAIKRLETEHKKLAEQQQKTAGPSAFAMVAKLAGGYLSIQGAIMLAQKALQEFNEERNAGRSETERLQESRSRLFQVSDGDFADLEKRADAAAEKYGVDRGLARSVLFSARSEGFEDQYESVVKLAPIIDPQAAATVAGQVRQLFSGENVSVDQAINAVLTGAKKSRLSFEQITAALPMVGEGGRQQGASMDESIAGASVLSSVFKSGETTGDRMKAYLSKLALNDTTKGKGLLGGFDAVQAMSEGDRKTFLGDSAELNAVHAAMIGLADEIRVRTGEIAAARRQAGGTDTALAEFYGTGTLNALKQSQQAAVGREVSAEAAYSADVSVNKAYRDYINSEANKGKLSNFYRFMENRAIDAVEFLGEDVANDAKTGMAVDPQLFAQFLAYQKEIAANTKTGSPMITRPGQDK